MNNKCINDVLLYLDDRLIRKQNGKYLNGAKIQSIHEALEEDYSLEEVQDAVQYLLENKIITRTSDTKQSFRAIKINGFTLEGKELVKKLKDDSISSKLQNALHKIIPMLSTGKTLAECIALFI